MNGSHGPESHDDRRDAATGDAYQPTTPTCGGDLSQLPADIRSCPYCGQTISAHEPEAEPTKVTEPQRGTGKKRKYSKITAMAGAGILATSIILGLPPPFPITGILITVVSAVIFIRVKEPMQAETTQVPPRVGKETVHEEPRELSPRRQRLRRYTKITAASGLLVAAASLIIAMNLPMSGLLNGVLVGLSITIASALARTFEGGLILRRTLGAVMITIPIIPMFFGGPPFLPLMSAPGLIIAVYLQTSRRSRLRSSVIVLAGAIIYAALWLYGFFPGTLIDGSWVVVVYQMWSPKFFYQAGLERLTTLWALQLEKTMALTAGTYLLLTALFSKVRAPTRWTALAVVTVSLLPLLLLAPPPARGIEGGAMLKVTVLTVDDVPVSKLEVDVGREPGPPPEGGLETSDDNGTATFYIRPGSYVVYFNAANYPTDLMYPNKVYQIDVSEGKPNKLTISLNYSSPGIAAPSGYSAWLTRAYDPNATHLAAISSGEQVHLWVRGPKGDSSEFSVYIPIAGEMVRANTSHLDPTGNPIRLGFGISVGSPSDVTIEIRIQRKVVASVTVNVS